MTIDLIDILRNSFTDKSYSDISQYVGISTESTKNGLKALVPVVLGSVLGNNTITSSKQPTWWNALEDEYSYTNDEYIDTTNISKPSFLLKGREVLSDIFRTNYDELVKSIGSVSGIPKEKSAKLIEVGVPLIISYLGNWMRRKEWKFNDLIASLIENKSFIMSEIPAGFSYINFGVNKLQKNHLPGTIDNFSETIESEVPIQEYAPRRNKNGLIWIIGLVVLSLLLWYLLGNKSSVREIREIRDKILVPDKSDSVADNTLRGSVYFDFNRIVMKGQLYKI